MWRSTSLALLALCRSSHGQIESETAPVTDHVYPRGLASSPPLLPTPTPSSPLTANSRDGVYALVTVASVALLSVLCVCVMVTVIFVLVVRIRRGWRRWRHSRRRSNSASSAPSSNGAAVHLLSSTVSSTQHFEWYRPRSHTPATPSPPPPLPSSPTPLPPYTPDSCHDYSEIGTPSPHATRVHLYDEVLGHTLVSGGAEMCVSGEGVSGEGVRCEGQGMVHQYSLLEDPSQEISASPVLTTPPSPPGHQHRSQWDDPDSIQDSSSLSEEGSISILDSSPQWIVSPVTRQRPLSELRPPRRVVPYRVSLILPRWEGRDRGPVLHRPPTLRRPVNSASCHTLQQLGRYNHLDGPAAYGSLEGKGLYATLEPFTSVESMRPRSRSCDARLYNYLRH